MRGLVKYHILHTSHGLTRYETVETDGGFYVRQGWIFKKYVCDIKNNSVQFAKEKHCVPVLFVTKDDVKHFIKTYGWSLT
jgi:hypothetical protein